MGAACQKCMKVFDQPQQKSNKTKQKQTEPLETGRQMREKVVSKEVDHRQTSFENRKGSNLEIQSNSSVRDTTKIFLKSKSTALFSSDGERRHSSILQFTLDSQSIIIKNPNQGQLGTFNNEDYYTLIDRMAFVRKTMDCLKVTTPRGQSELNCPPQFMFSTLYVSEGLPVQNIQEVEPNKVIQIGTSPINIKLKIECKSCTSKLKMTYCRGIININQIECQNCQNRGKFKIVDIEANVPIWGEGEKIENNQQIENAPAVIRAMGCIICLRFSNTQSLKCGCLICKTCLSANQDINITDMCKMCEGSIIL